MSCFSYTCFDTVESNPFLNLNGEYLIRFYHIENPYAGDAERTKSFIEGVVAQAKATPKVFTDDEAFDAGRAALRAAAKRMQFYKYTKADVIAEVACRDPYEDSDERLSRAWMHGLASFDNGVIADGAVTAFGEDYYRVWNEAIESALDCSVLMSEAYQQKLKWRR